MASNPKISDLLQLDKQELAEKIIQLEAHNRQLKNILSKNINGPKSGNKRKNPFDFTKYSWRRVLFHICYFGWDYRGLAVQEDSGATIEHHLFQALITSCLIQSRETSNYHRCGRTDKGVSAFGQVISITVRSKHKKEALESGDVVSEELPYCKMLNRLLPKDIRVIAWRPIPTDQPDFSARFDCKSRLYKYYFPRGDLDLAAMKTASSYLVGSHDFRNLCKMDVANGVVEYVRNVIRADIVPLHPHHSDTPKSMYCLEIEGNAFLWHQIRCIMGVLVLVGQRRESPLIVRELLDVHANPRKPQYNMALDVPLNLFQCEYDLLPTSWVFDREELDVVLSEMKKQWTMHNIKSTQVAECIKWVESQLEVGGDVVPSDGYTDVLLQGVKPRQYKQLLNRDKCSSLEDRIDHYRKRRKLPNGHETTLRDDSARSTSEQFGDTLL